MPTKGKLLLTAVSIVNWIAGCASFRTETKSVAAVRSGTRAKVSSTKLGSLFSCASFPLMEHIKVFAFSGPNGEPIATPSICEVKESGKIPQRLKLSLTWQSPRTLQA